MGPVGFVERIARDEAVKETPLICTAESARAILDDRKTQTRRVIKPQPSHFHTFPGKLSIPCSDDPKRKGPTCTGEIKCPYGIPGDRLWVRETWHKESSQTLIRYRASGDDLHPLKKWKSPRYMPRWASRINLEVTGVRVERVQDIHYNDAVREGVSCFLDEQQTDASHIAETKGMFRELWDRINAKRGYGWGVNPWVWVIEFKRAENSTE